MWHVMLGNIWANYKWCSAAAYAFDNDAGTFATRANLQVVASGAFALRTDNLLRTRLPRRDLVEIGGAFLAHRHPALFEGWVELLPFTPSAPV
jgi:hypothetical protein